MTPQPKQTTKPKLMIRALALLLAALTALGLAACTGTADGRENGGNDVINPMVGYETLEEINARAGSAIRKPDGATATDEAYYVIGGDLADYRFRADGVSYSIRASKTADDISGIWIGEGTVYADEALSGTPSVYEGDGFVTMRWQSGGVQYLITAQSDGVAYDAVRDRMMAYAALTIPDGERYLALEGTYMDSVGQRAALYAGSLGDALRVLVYWSSSAYEGTSWTMTCRLDETGALAYGDARCVVGRTDENGEYAETVLYENGSGFFALSDGTLLWTGAADEACRACIFEPITE